MISTRPSVAKALWLAAEVETLARQYLTCLQTGIQPPVLSDSEIDDVIYRMADYGLQTGSLNQR